MSSPADILCQALCDLGVITRGALGLDWPGYVGFAPDAPAPDNIVSFYNTQGTNDGRMMRTGEQIDHPGVSIRVRAEDDPTGYNQAKAIQEAVDAIYKRSVTMEDGIYTLQNASRSGQIIGLGQERDRTRQLFTINVLLTLKKES